MGVKCSITTLLTQIDVSVGILHLYLHVENMCMTEIMRKKGGQDHKIRLTPPPCFEMPVSSQESSVWFKLGECHVYVIRVPI